MVVIIIGNAIICNKCSLEKLLDKVNLILDNNNAYVCKIYYSTDLGVRDEHYTSCSLLILYIEEISLMSD